MRLVDLKENRILIMCRKDTILPGFIKMYVKVSKVFKLDDEGREYIGTIFCDIHGNIYECRIEEFDDGEIHVFNNEKPMEYALFENLEEWKHYMNDFYSDAKEELGYQDDFLGNIMEMCKIYGDMCYNASKREYVSDEQAKLSLKKTFQESRKNLTNDHSVYVVYKKLDEPKIEEGILKNYKFMYKDQKYVMTIEYRPYNKADNNIFHYSYIEDFEIGKEMTEFEPYMPLYEDENIAIYYSWYAAVDVIEHKDEK